MYGRRPNHMYQLYEGKSSEIHQPMTSAPIQPTNSYGQLSPYTQFAKPIQPQFMSPYSHQPPGPMPKGNPNSSFLNYFYDENGQMDYGKVLTTVSQVANAFHQVTPVVQQINSLINSFRNS